MTEKFMIIYHKVDLDGVTSASIVMKYLLEKKVNIKDIKLCPHNYGFELPKTKGYNVFVVDLGLPFDDLKNIQEESDSLVWIDHHYTAIKEYDERKNELVNKIEGLRNAEGTAACLLTYKYLFNDDIPKTITLLSDYDVWNNSDESYWENEVMPFQMYMKTYYFANSTDCIHKLANIIKNNSFLFESKAIDFGRSMYDYQKSMWGAYSHYAKMSDYEGFKVLHINSLARNSHIVMGHPKENEADIICVYTYNNDKWEYSMYHNGDNPNVNCGDIAKSFGGGGHKCAAGFTLDRFIF